MFYAMKSNYKKLGDYIRLVDERNTDGSVTRLLGVSIEKKFIESIANTIGTDMSIYKIVRKGQFAYGPVTSRNGDIVIPNLGQKVLYTYIKSYQEIHYDQKIYHDRFC